MAIIYCTVLFMAGFPTTDHRNPALRQNISGKGRRTVKMNTDNTTQCAVSIYDSTVVACKMRRSWWCVTDVGVALFNYKYLHVHCICLSACLYVSVGSMLGGTLIKMHNVLFMLCLPQQSNTSYPY